MEERTNREDRPNLFFGICIKGWPNLVRAKLKLGFFQKVGPKPGPKLEKNFGPGSGWGMARLNTARFQPYMNLVNVAYLAFISNNCS